MSERSELAQRIASKICEWRLTNPFGGDVEKSGNHYSILFAVPRYLDGLVQVYGKKFIRVSCQGPLVHGDYNAVYESEENAIEFLRRAFVEHDFTTAQDVPVKPSKDRQ